MVMVEQQMNLFDVGSEYALVQCASSDLALGKGIATEFNKRFDLRNKLVRRYGEELIGEFKAYGGGAVLYSDTENGRDFFVLITKEMYWGKPTYTTLRQSLTSMKYKCLQLNIDKLAMPKIGCGLDRLDWPSVKRIISDVFWNTDIEIRVCYL